MADENQAQNLPAALVQQVAGIPQALVPATLKALDRLVGGLVDIPAAWLAQQKGKIDAQTDAFKAVEAEIGRAAASQAVADPAIVERAASVLVRKAYRQQANREAVAAAAVNELHSGAANDGNPTTTGQASELEEEWLNVFERYAEEASTERMQKLWGRVLSGEIRKHGSFSMRSLRFLSEFSQSDGLMFAKLCEGVFAECVPTSLARPHEDADIRDLLSLQAAGLIDGAENGLQLTMKFDDHGFAWLREGNLILLLAGTAGERFAVNSYALTPIGRELMSLLDRDARASARRVAGAIKTPQIKAAHLAIPAGENRLVPIEMLWKEDVPAKVA